MSELPNLEDLPEVAGSEWPEFGCGPAEQDARMPPVFEDGAGLRWDSVWYRGAWHKTPSQTPLSS